MTPQLPEEYSYLQGKVLSSRVYPEFFHINEREHVLNAGFGDGPQVIVYAGSFGSMVGVDVNAERLARARRLMDAVGVRNVEIIEGNVENIPRADATFDVILAIDIIEHVEHPDRFLVEMRRLIVPGGRMLITFPAMHDRFTDAMSTIGRRIGRKGHVHPIGWHPDHHQRELPVPVWIDMVRHAGFQLKRSRATTMFPPLHLYGLSRFWLSNRFIHAIDRRVASLPGIQRLGQTVMAEFIPKERA